ncbi:unnamed protein product [Protopolystoma xenopodis]|uniref:Uncharacterized protein n=1 Tax=Protopolystoma xenopodis TaxID=117903 RepID=A0A448WIX5_9PLAT|nr:unnamed protein product [Protopolystoma xenopodis]
MGGPVGPTLYEVLSYSSYGTPNVGFELGTFPDVSLASSVSLTSLSTKLELIKETKEINPSTNFLPNGCVIPPVLVFLPTPFHRISISPYNNFRFVSIRLLERCALSGDFISALSHLLVYFPADFPLDLQELLI